MTRHRDLMVTKPRALHKGSSIAVISPASPGDEIKLQAGIAELRRLGFRVAPAPNSQSVGYFAATHEIRRSEFVSALDDKQIDGLIAARGGYGSSHLLDAKFNSRLAHQKCIVGFSDVNALQVFIWQVRHWVSFYGPMAAAGFAAGAGNAGGYDEKSFLQAVQTTSCGWTLPLSGETLVPGSAQGRLLGGCLSLLQTSLATGWELDTRDAILVLEDRGMKPYQVDRALLHLLQAGKFQDLRGIVLGDFPECNSPNPAGPSVRDVCRDILSPLGVPIIFGAPVGHTNRPMLTLPLGLQAKLDATGEGTLEILESAVLP
jgi:muramoyltetrapeptide carboxypeptidase